MYFEENLVLIPLFMYKNFFKPLIGILLSFFGLMVCCIPMIIIAITIKLDSKGPIMFRQVRLGKGQRPFRIYKFRTMCDGAFEKGGVVTSADDTRITKVGAVLRRTSLDELPQLFNVLRGEMSLVGPRPIIKEELERYNEEVDYYLLSKPGMTGLWQVSGRSDVDYETRVYLDAWYVKNWSMWNDIAILFKTIIVVIKKDGAY